MRDLAAAESISHTFIDNNYLPNYPHRIKGAYMLKKWFIRFAYAGCTVHQSFTPFAERKRISFEFDREGGDLNAQYDKEKLDKVFNNLLSNAFKFTPKGGHIKLSVKDVSQGDRDYTEITVKDNGAGISRDNIDKVFDRFYQVDGFSTREFEGYRYEYG